MRHVELVILDCQHNQDTQGLCTFLKSSDNYLKRTSWEIGRIRLDEVFRNMERFTLLKLLDILKHSTKCCLCDYIWSSFSQQTSNQGNHPNILYTYMLNYSITYISLHFNIHNLYLNNLKTQSLKRDEFCFVLCRLSLETVPPTASI